MYLIPMACIHITLALARNLDIFINHNVDRTGHLVYFIWCISNTIACIYT